VLVASGARPAIYAVYRALVDDGDEVVFPVPSWNNDHYTQIVGARPVLVECDASTNFLPTASMLRPVIRNARLLALCSPVNPRARCSTRPRCATSVSWSSRRTSARRQRPAAVHALRPVYWMLTTAGVEPREPVSLVPQIAPYTVAVDAISKAFASTGLRVGWAVGPADIIKPMNDIIGHVRRWAPRPEQVATAKFMADDARSTRTSRRCVARRRAAWTPCTTASKRCRAQGLPVESVRPQGAIYVSARFALHGMQTPERRRPAHRRRRARLSAQRRGLAAVPFGAFGAPGDNGGSGYRSASCLVEQIEAMMPPLKRAIEALGRTRGRGRALTTGPAVRKLAFHDNVRPSSVAEIRSA
jgi:aspartate aminotransferase